MTRVLIVELFSACGPLIVVIMIIYGLVLLFSPSWEHRVLGISSCSLYLLIAVFWVASDIIGVAVLAPMAFLVFCVTSISIFAGKNKVYRKMGRIWLILSAIFVTIFGIYLHYNPFTGIKRDYFDSCIGELSRLESAQHLYFNEYKRYAVNFKELSEYSDILCKSDVSFCNLFGKEKFEDKCKSITMSMEKNGMFKIEAQTKHTFSCYICITPEGMSRDQYWDCDDPKTKACRWEPY